MAILHHQCSGPFVLSAMPGAIANALLAIVLITTLDPILHVCPARIIVAAAANEEALPTKPKPNIVILFADNLAYDDVGAFQRHGGGDDDRRSSSAASSSAPPPPRTSRTPRIDSIAASGLKLLNWNSPAVLCSASRAALLTGRYPVRTGVYPRVFEPDAAHGLLPNETTIAEYLREEGYATKIVGKWHLGHRPEYLPTRQGFDEWFGIPYHMSGGSLDEHICGRDANSTMWLPLFDGRTIVEQPVNLADLAPRYVDAARDFILRQQRRQSKPFFLYLAFSHVHQLCAPRHAECQWASSHFSRDGRSYHATFGDAVEEMDWIAGGVLDALRDAGVEDDTLIVFTSDNGPWVAEGSCAGSKGPFEGRWLRDNVDLGCTACPSEYVPSPLPGRPRRCVYPSTEFEVEGVHCGEDTGLGSAWEANVRMPALVKWPGGDIPAGVETMDMVSTMDVLPTVLAILGKEIPRGIDGVDVSDVLFGDPVVPAENSDVQTEERSIFFWRDGFESGPLPKPYGRFDVVAVKIGRTKLWYYTKSAHYNEDVEVSHHPPLLFDVLADPAEAFPLDPRDYGELIDRASRLVAEHKASVNWTYPLTLSRDPKFLPCSNPNAGCRTASTSMDTTMDLSTS